MQNYNLSFSEDGVPVINGEKLEEHPTFSGGARNYSAEGFPYLISSPAETSNAGIVFVNAKDAREPALLSISPEAFDTIAEHRTTPIEVSGNALGALQFDQALTASLGKDQLQINEKTPGAVSVLDSEGKPVFRQEAVSFELANGNVFTAIASQYHRPEKTVELINNFPVTKNIYPTAQEMTEQLQNQFTGQKITACTPDFLIDSLDFCVASHAPPLPPAANPERQAPIPRPSPAR